MRWVSLVVLCASTAAYAKPKSRADELFEQGRKHMDAGRYDQACAAFEESQQLDSAVTTLLNLGACREKLAQLASAVAVFRAAERTARREGTATSTQLADIAAGHIKRLEPKLSSLTIQVPRSVRIDGLTIERNGIPVESALWDVPVPLDGGSYKIVARAPGHTSFLTTVRLAPERDTKAVRVPALAEGSESGPTDGPKQNETEDEHHDDSQPRASGRSVVWPILFGLGAVGAGVGAVVFWKRGDDYYDRSKMEPDPSRQDALWENANRSRYIADAFIGAGAVCAGVAIYLLVRGGGGDKDSDDDDSVAIQPSVRGDGMMIQLSGRY